jgi:hypothetical protein
MYFTSFDRELSTIVDSLYQNVYEILKDDFDSFYRGIFCIPGAAGAGEFRLFYERKSDEDRIYAAVAVPFTSTRDARTDKIFLKQNNVTIPVTGDAASNPRVVELMRQFVTTVTALNTGHPYIVIPNTDYTKFTLGSTITNRYFTLKED